MYSSPPCHGAKTRLAVQKREPPREESEARFSRHTLIQGVAWATPAIPEVRTMLSTTVRPPTGLSELGYHRADGIPALNRET